MRGGLAIALAACAALAWQQQTARYDGEFGLAVYQRGDSLIVHWITAKPADGRLEVIDAAAATQAPLARVNTPRAIAHRAAVTRVRAGQVLLRYGGEDAATQHETIVSLETPRRAPSAVPAADSLYVLGDTHGMYDALRDGLRNASLIDSAGKWTGGRKQLVFDGDMLDRGPDAIALLWFVYRLEREAAAAGGRVHVVLGNHEIMVMLGDLRYVHLKEAQIAEAHRVTYDRLFDPRTSILGRWLTTKPGVLRVGDLLFAHGGVTPVQARQSLQQLNDSLNAYMREDLFYNWADTTVAIRVDSATYQRRFDFFWDDNSLFWHRGYIQSDTLGTALTQVLQHFDASTLIVGHTPVPTITARYDGRVIAAHSEKLGAELLLLVRKPGGGYDRFRVGQPGGPVRF